MPALRDDLEDKYVTVNGYRIRYIEKGSGPPLVCLHGLGAALSGDQWLSTIDSFSTVAHVYCPDQLGYGLSDLPDDGYSFDGFVDTVKGFCDSLGLQQVDVAGQSMGGWIAALYAYYHPECVRRVVLIGNAGLNPPLAGIGRPVELMNRDQLRNSLTREWGTFVPITDTQVDELERRMQRPGRLDAYRALRSVGEDESNREKYSLRDKLPGMPHPILVIWGDNAPGIRLQYGIEAFQLAPNARLVVTLGGDHNAMAFTPREVESQVVAFLTAPEIKQAKKTG
jgi:pimeloyl-ACP methyl ester carboxylesterase